MPSDTSRAQEIREERMRLHSRMKELAEEAKGRTFSDEEKQEWDRIDDRLNEAKEEVDELEERAARISDIEEDLDRRQERLTTSHSGELKGPDPEEEQELHRKALVEYIRRGDAVYSDERFEEIRYRMLPLRGSESWRGRELERRTLNSQLKGTNNVGGFTVPTDFRAELMVALKEFGGMRRAARIINTDNGRNLQWPRSDDTGNTAKLLAEATAPSTSTAVPFGQVTLEAHKYRVGPIKISREIIEDSAFDIESIVRDAMTTRFGRATNAHYTTRSSTEATGPHGIVNDSTGAVKITAGSTNLTPDSLLDLLHSVDPAYRMSAAFMFNDGTLKTIRKLRETSTGGANIGAFLWQPSMRVGEPDTLFGHPIIINQDLSTVGSSGDKHLWFGDFSYYIIRDVSEATLRLTERYADEDVIALYAFMRTDGRSVLPSTVAARKPYRAMHST